MLGYLILIILGTILLSLPWATVANQGLSTIDALFTATSATAVTGLIVVNTAHDLSLFGQLVVLVLIQIGGLGLMTSSTLVVLLLGRKISFKERIIVKEEINHFDFSGLLRVVKYIISLTLGIELLGAVLLFFRFNSLFSVGKAIYFAIFHAISAFCNAGFDLFGTSLEGFVTDPYTNLVITTLFIIGGIGFAVLADIYHKREFSPLTLHSKLVLLLTVILIGVGVCGIFLLEFANPKTLGDLSVGNKLVAAYFQGVTPRTAGFNTVPIGNLTAGSLFLVIILMIIGASPGSTGGGLKTTTVGVLLLTTYSLVRGKKTPQLFGRTILQSTIYKALAVTLSGLLFVVLASLVLTVTETASFIRIFFEAISAFGTVGLSTGITSSLTVIGKLVVVVLMFIGRVGPLTLAVALGEKVETDKVKYPAEEILIG
ncbi:TrkH family potassium uptake protein [Halanaerobaculum tunisiense]